MIPYDDLVAALASWRQRQGLPVATPPSVFGARAAAAATPTAPRAIVLPPAAARPGPPSAPPRGMPLPAPPLDDEYEGALVEDAAYDAAGDDYVVALGSDAGEPTGEPTAVGGPDGNRSGKRRNDW